LETLLLVALEQRPDELGCPGLNWTVPLLRDYLQRSSGQGLSDDTLRRELDRLGYVWKRSRYVLPPDPQREKKTRDPAAPAGPAAA
jgi:transposase